MQLIQVTAHRHRGNNAIELYCNVIDRCRYLGDDGAEKVAIFMNLDSPINITRGKFAGDGFEGFLIILFIDKCYYFIDINF